MMIMSRMGMGMGMGINLYPILKAILEQIRELPLDIPATFLHNLLPGTELLVVQQTSIHSLLDLLPTTTTTTFFTFAAHLLPDEDELLPAVAPAALEVAEDGGARQRVPRQVGLGHLAAPGVARGDGQHHAGLGPLAELFVYVKK